MIERDTLYDVERLKRKIGLLAAAYLTQFEETCRTRSTVYRVKDYGNESDGEEEEISFIVPTVL